MATAEVQRSNRSKGQAGKRLYEIHVDGFDYSNCIFFL